MPSLGFITIATGHEHYYKMAYHLLNSYRHFSANLLPFAILAGQENIYTSAFDDCILLQSSRQNYLDKLDMFPYLPYETSIFIDADCLAYGDLNGLFPMFQSGDDFSCFGRVLPLEDKTGWFEYQNLGELKEKVSYVVGLHGGIYYMRKTEKCRAVLETAQQLAPRYREFQFKGNFATPGDEPLVALSMALNRCKPIPHDLSAILCYWEHVGQMRLSVPKGKAATRDGSVQTNLLHWGTRFTKTPLYKKQIADLAVMERGSNPFSLLGNQLACTAATGISRVGQLEKRISGKIKRTMLK